jgi:hypothetical protein
MLITAIAEGAMHISACNQSIAQRAKQNIAWARAATISAAPQHIARARSYD